MELKWNTYVIYKSDEEWNQGKEELLKLVEEFSGLLNTLVSSKNSFLSVTKKKILIDELIEKVYCYPRRFIDLNIFDEIHKKMFDEALNIYNKILENTAKFESIVIDSEEIIRKFLKQDDVNFYQRYYDVIFKKGKHLASDKQTFYKCQNIRSEFQKLTSNMQFETISIDGKEHIVNNQTFSSLLLNEDESIRKEVYESLNKSYLNVANEITRLFKEKLKNDLEDAKSKNYTSVKEMKLSELELDSNLIDKTIKETNNNLNIMHSYISLKKELAGVNEYHLYDSALPLDKDKEKKESLSFSDAIKKVKDTLSILGSNYLDKIDTLLNQGSIDAYPSDAKRKLDFTGITYAGIPYICLNFTGKRSNIRTLTHEFGHAVNLMYSKEKNDFTYFEFSLFLTEIVAKVNECIYNETLLKDNDLESLLAVISALINSLFNQIMFTEFEDEVATRIQAGEDPTMEEISNIYENLLIKYNGKDLTLHQYDRYAWLRINHFIMQDSYYLYQYSIGTSLANAIYSLLKNEKGFQEQYIEFLGIGNKLNLVDSLKLIGIDLNDSQIYKRAFEILNEFIETYKELLLSQK